MSDPFSLLNVSLDADEESIERAWKAAILAAHPDRHASASEAVREAYEERTRELNEALATLLDPVRRADATLEHQQLHGTQRNTRARATIPPPASGATEPPPPRPLTVAEAPPPDAEPRRRFFGRRNRPGR